MALTNTSSTFGGVTRTLHWLTALLIFSTFALGYLANDLAHQIASSDFDGSQVTIDRAVWLFSLHKTLGVATFVIALLRIFWAMTQPKPGLLHPDRKAEALVAETVHWLLYGSLVLVPLTGWIHHASTEGYAPILWPIGQNLPMVSKSEYVAQVFSVLHWLFAWLLFVVVFLHVAGAAKHHLIDKDSTLRRMLPLFRDPVEPPTQHQTKIPPVLALCVCAAAVMSALVLDDLSKLEADNIEQVALSEVQSDWEVEAGSISIIVAQLGNPVVGEFSDWTAAIQFDDPPLPGPAGSVEVVVSIGSLSLGSVTDKAMGKDFFNTNQFPTAQFKANILKLTEGYEASGILTLRDQSVPVTIPFDLEIDGGSAKMNGRLTLNRHDFGVGASVTDENTLAYAVDVRVELEAFRAN